MTSLQYAIYVGEIPSTQPTVPDRRIVVTAEHNGTAIWSIELAKEPQAKDLLTLLSFKHVNERTISKALEEGVQMVLFERDPRTQLLSAMNAQQVPS